ncbi:UDP-sulfoquinovose synthase, chloroplastic [Porphyridium purpureum]|uniref:UDP-sulfoquinovose synthase, chloroplastic n=1 Tax=Porphyridium purpureum TaxID=35688 RepID=A0A5J4YR42_PORPP|nr:UDP-sulfoquinovose synthase, chloroplastic [Porphyridium purpureum]|eukprot:POR3693..scf296_7
MAFVGGVGLLVGCKNGAGGVATCLQVSEASALVGVGKRSAWQCGARGSGWRASSDVRRAAARVAMSAGTDSVAAGRDDDAIWSSIKAKKVVVLGGDGFCGWPTALFLSELGHEVVVVDNLSRRKIDVELECDSLTPIQSMNERMRAWEGVGGSPIRFVYMDVAAEYQRLLQLLESEKPDAVVHFAEQRAAPYSQKNSATKRYTVENNVGGTHNVLAAVVESGLDIHVVHLGTMGVYGYGTAGGEIPEGYIDVLMQPGNREARILHPMYPGSVYHATKCLDQILFQFYQRNDQLRITDLHQGIVWGTNTAQTVKDERLVNRFDYDSDYGTVLNRFLMQAALEYPLTVYGTGGQTRAFIHIQDTAKCIALAVENPPKSGAMVEIFNQVAETHRVRDLARIISEMTGCEVKNISNPRNEADENELVVANRKFQGLGWSPITLQAGLLDEVVNIAAKYKDRCDVSKVLPSSFWNKTRLQACGTSQAAWDKRAANGVISPADEEMLRALSKGSTDTYLKLKEAMSFASKLHDTRAGHCRDARSGIGRDKQLCRWQECGGWFRKTRGQRSS